MKNIDKTLIQYNYNVIREYFILLLKLLIINNSFYA